MKRLPITITLSALVLALSACSNLERSRDLSNPSVSGNTLAQQVCSTCHGGLNGVAVNGNSLNPTYPNLAGQTAEYLQTEVQEFHDQTRKDKLAQQYMWGLASHLTAEQMKGISQFYSQQKPLPNPTHSDPALVSAGQKLFAEGLADKGVPACLSCHGAGAEGNGPIPRLAGQHANYLYKQLMVFNNDAEREAEHKDLERPHGSAMEGIAHGLSDAQKREVAAYLQSL